MMHNLLEARPAGFLSPEQAVEWQYVTYLVLTTAILTSAIS